MSVLATNEVLDELLAERRRQVHKHGDQTHLPDGTGPLVQWVPRNWAPNLRAGEYFKALCRRRSQVEGDGTISFLDILIEEVAEAFEEDDPAKLRAELVQVAAVAVQWIEAIDRRPAGEPRG